jgi:hypothetical protein
LEVDDLAAEGGPLAHVREGLVEGGSGDAERDARREGAAVGQGDHGLPETVALHADERVLGQLDVVEHEVDVRAVAQPERLRLAGLAGGHARCVPLDRERGHTDVGLSEDHEELGLRPGGDERLLAVDDPSGVGPARLGV